ncbi:anti-sigma factor domain-containing protein [Streptomyces sp. NPDC005263]|uniref:anti-sigma factor n=1 Tax=Streptomyces sp. NPDC005263 TaxID=3364711 RepID=UPI00368CF97F
MITTDPHGLTGAYALHALDAHEREVFELHLADCGACHLEVAGFAATAARLGLAASAPPPPVVLEEVLRRVTSVGQETAGPAAVYDQTPAAVLAAPDAKARASTLVGGARGTVVVSAGLDEAVLVVSGMAEPPSGKVYQLWFDDDGRMRHAGLMDPRRSSQAVSLTGAVDGARAVRITVEPTGGSPEPSSSWVAVLKVPV